MLVASGEGAAGAAASGGGARLAGAGAAPPPTVGGLFRGFLSLGLMGFGGVLPLARHMLVEERRWLNGAEFSDLLGLCQFLPGGNVVNLSVAVGLRFRGVPGALADNYEGAAVTTDGARIFLWLVSDNNFNRWQRSLLVQFELVGLPVRAPDSKKAAR